MAWFLLLIAGLFEIAWALGLKTSEGFTRFWPSVATVVCLALSMYFLAMAARSLPMGTAYAVWVGIGAAGTALCGIWLLGEPITTPRLFFLGLLVVAVAGLRFSA